MTDIKCDSDVCKYKGADGYCTKFHIELGLGWCQDEDVENEDEE